MEKTIAALNEKRWYRFIKIIYIFFFIFFLVLAIIIIDLTLSNCLVAFLGIVILFELLKRAFYYVYIGTINPKK